MLLCLSLGLFPASAGADDTLDQSQPVSQSSQTVSYSIPRAQIFTAGAYGTLDRVSLRLENYWSSLPSGAELIVSVQTVIGGLPSGKQIGSGHIALSAIPAYESGGDWVDVGIRGALVQARTQYALVLQTNVWNANVNWWWAYEGATSGSSYTGGEMAFNDGTSWISEENYDFTFKTYVIPDTLDQYQLSIYKYDWTDKWAQIFTAGISGVLDRVWVFVRYNETIDVTIETVNGGYPSGTVIGQGTWEGSTNILTGSWIDVGISGGTTVTAGTQYAIILHADPYANPYGLEWFYTMEEDAYPQGYMLNEGYDGNWKVFTDLSGEYTANAAFKTYVVQPLLYASRPVPATITPCSSGVCPAVSGSVTPPDSTARVTSNVQFKELPDGKVHGILNFNDSRTGNFVLKGCTTSSNACLLTVTTFACTDEHTIEIRGTYNSKKEPAGNYQLKLNGVKDGIGTFSLTAGSYTYTLTHEGIVDVTCPQ